MNYCGFFLMLISIKFSFFCTCSIERLSIHFVSHRALLHFLDPDKFKSKDDFIYNYKNLSSFDENEVIFYSRTTVVHFEDVTSV